MSDTGTQSESVRRAGKRQSQHMYHFSTLAGKLERTGRRHNYCVKFRDLLSYDKFIYRVWARIISYGTLLLVLGYGALLFAPQHWIITLQPDSPTYLASLLMLVTLAILVVFLAVGTFSATHSTLKAKDPVPVRPPNGLRVAFTTTRAPGEPTEMVKKTLEAAKAVRYKNGKVDVWLLDETGDPVLIDMCMSLGVMYFSRSSFTPWNTPKPTSKVVHVIKSLYCYVASFGKRKMPKYAVPNPYFASKSKHGNYNAWFEYLKYSNRTYDILAGVDTDHVPEVNYLERLLGYFRDKDVAYAVGPQVYGNYHPGLNGLVARWAESQASFFQSTIQRAGNASQSAMFVGTNYAVRMNVLRQIGGFQPCITEDMATGLVIHAHKNPATGNNWKSVYTPDVLAVGVGPDYWGPYFTQQWRWAAGTFDTWRRTVWKTFYRVKPSATLHYFLMLTFYPMAALTWLLGIISSLTYLITGATAILVPWNQFIALYLMLLTMQLSLYFWNRRYNVSPHEPKGSFGVAGMVISTLTAPIYLSAFVRMIIGKKATFVVTAKDRSENHDWFPAFRSHLMWGVVLMVGLIYGVAHGHNHPAMLIWVASQLLVCLIPFGLGMALAVPERYKRIEQKNITVMSTGARHA